MAPALTRVRMLRQIDQFPMVMQLDFEELYDLPADCAQRLIDAGAAEAAAPKATRLEAAALAGPTRRG
jgi:hypothetical protein